MVRKIKVKTLYDDIKEFEVENIYFVKVKTVESEFLAELSYQFYIGELKKKEEEVYGAKKEYKIDEATYFSIKRDFPKLKTFEEVQVYHG